MTWLEFCTVWFKISSALDQLSVVVAVGLFVYSLVKKQKRDVAVLVAVSFLSWYIFTDAINVFRHISGYMLYVFFALAVKDLFFAYLMFILSSNPAMPAVYALQCVISLLMVAAMNIPLFTEQVLYLYVMPVWSITYAALMVLKLVILFTDVHYDKGGRFSKFTRRNHRSVWPVIIGHSHSYSIFTKEAEPGD